MIGFGIDKGYKLAFRCKKCVVQDAQGHEIEINEVRSCTVPGAIISHDVAQIFADQLSEKLKCGIEVLLANYGFEFKFQSVPDQSLTDTPPSFSIGVADLNDFYRRHHSNEPDPIVITEISKHLNEEGAKVIRWFLLRIYMHPREPKNDPFVLAYSSERASWTPPKKLPGYDPIPPCRASEPEAEPQRSPRAPTTRRSK